MAGPQGQQTEAAKTWTQEAQSRIKDLDKRLGWRPLSWGCWSVTDGLGQGMCGVWIRHQGQTQEVGRC